MIWLSVDPGTGKSGIARWDRHELVDSKVIKPCGAKGSYWIGHEKVGSKTEAWINAVNITNRVFMERGAGFRPNVINGQAKLRGYIEGVCAMHPRKPICEEINVSEWKRVIKEDQGISWPKDSARQKQLAISLVQQIYNREVTEDEADAILIGHAAIRMGLLL